MTSMWTNGELITAAELNKWCNTGLDSAKGTPTVIGEAYLATDTNKIYYSTNGTSWDQTVTMKLNNILRGITPTAVQWGTTPTSLSNTTDGSLSTVTGTGSKTISGSGVVGYLTFDLGSVKTFLFTGRLGIWRTAGALRVYVDGNDVSATYNDSNWRQNDETIAYTYYNYERVSDITPTLLTCRYPRFRVYGEGSGTYYTKFYEVMAYEGFVI